MISPYEFKSEDAERFAFSQGIKTRTANGQLQFVWCPYCHGGGKDKNTFYISMKTGQFECKRAGCMAKGNMITLAKDFAESFDLGTEVTRYYNIANYNGKFRKFHDKHIEASDPAIAYMATRGISANVCRVFEITSKDTENGTAIVFPFRDGSGELKFIKYRNPSRKKGDKGSKEWCEANCMPILFGMDKCLSTGPLIITEGQIDSLSLAEAGIENAVSVPTGANGFTWVPHCWDWLQKFNQIIVFGDHEKGHITLFDELKRRMPDKVCCVKPENYLDCKDANEILLKYGREQLQKCVTDIDLPKPKNIIRVSDVKKVDIENSPCIPTGFAEVDRLLSGGIHCSQLVILTGKRGDGKSTVAGMLMAEALKDGESVFAYSGELPDYYFKNWINRQLAGKSEIKQTEWDNIDKWYLDRFYLYSRDNLSMESEKPESEAELLLKAINEAIVKYSCRLIIIDNLMTAIDTASDKVYGIQSKFVGDLVRICKEHDVAIILVAHPRKSNGYVNDETDEVSGSGDITNRADIVLKYGKPNPEKYTDMSDMPDRILSILKNRLTGKVTGSAPIGLWYDESSKRISDRKGEFSKVYISEKTRWEEIKDEEDEEIPF